MRPIKSNLDRLRGNKRLKIKRKFILAFEGYRTEVQYFQGVNNYRSKLEISSLIEVYPLCRFPTQSGHSAPERVLDLLEEYIKFLECESYSVNLFINTFINEIIQEKEIPEIKDKIEKYLKEANDCLLPLSDEDGLIEDLDEATKKCLGIYCKIFGDVGDVNFDVPDPIDYRKERDVVCVIIDRDQRASSRCDDFFIRCRNNGFEPYMTNPCFEMWLLLHFDEVLPDLLVSKKELYLNEEVNGVRYTERRLDELLKNIPANDGKGYFKNDLNFYDYVDRVNNAIKNEKSFCNDIRLIKNNVGSNIGSLIEKMRMKD